jgi:hypothetical protein
MFPVTALFPAVKVTEVPVVVLRLPSVVGE